MNRKHYHICYAFSLIAFACSTTVESTTSPDSNESDSGGDSELDGTETGSVDSVSSSDDAATSDEDGGEVVSDCKKDSDCDGAKVCVKNECIVLGCSGDSDCKGSRICEDHVCVDPSVDSDGGVGGSGGSDGGKAGESGSSGSAGNAGASSDGGADALPEEDAKCIPTDCDSYAYEQTGDWDSSACGTPDDGCGKPLNCGTCDGVNSACSRGTSEKNLDSFPIEGTSYPNVCGGGCIWSQHASNYIGAFGGGCAGKLFAHWCLIENIPPANDLSCVKGTVPSGSEMTTAGSIWCCDDSYGTKVEWFY